MNRDEIDEFFIWKSAKDTKKNTFLHILSRIRARLRLHILKFCDMNCYKMLRMLHFVINIFWCVDEIT